MTTLLREPETRAGHGQDQGKCDGCPRCQDSGAPLCPQYHQDFGGLHPVCKVCRHCVLRGKHQDDGSDLDDHKGRGHQGMGPISNN